MPARAVRIRPILSIFVFNCSYDVHGFCIWSSFSQPESGFSATHTNSPIIMSLTHTADNNKIVRPTPDLSNP
jgi:hypothetical protein